MLEQSYNTIQYLCRHSQRMKLHARVKKKNLLTQEHINFLLDPHTLKKWAGYTLKMRRVFFHRRFPETQIAVTTLRRLYLKNKIKRKKVRQEKYLPPLYKIKFDSQRQDLIEKLDSVQKENRKIIYLDETNFTKLSFQNKDWSRSNENQHVDQRDIYTGYRSVIASISEEKGVEFIKIYSTAITSDLFIRYLKQISNKNMNQPLALFQDQLQVHKSKHVRPFYSSLDIVPIYNVGYSPEFNPIESVFSQVKRVFCRERLNKLVNN